MEKDPRCLKEYCDDESDKLYSSILKRSSGILGVSFSYLFRVSAVHCTYHSGWKNSVVAPSEWKCGRKLPHIYCNITLASITGKTFTRIVSMPSCPDSPSQHGSPSDASCMNKMMTAIESIAKRTNRDRLLMPQSQALQKPLGRISAFRHCIIWRYVE